MAGDVERVLGSIDARLTSAERQARAFRAPVLTGVDPEDIAEGVTWARTDHGDGKGAAYVRVADTTHRIATDKQMVTPVQTTDPSWGTGQIWTRSDHGFRGQPYITTPNGNYRLLTHGSSLNFSAEITTLQSCTSTGYGDLPGGAGPSVTITQSGAAAQNGLIIISCTTWASATGHIGLMSWEVTDTPFGGSYTFGPSDPHSCRRKYMVALDDVTIMKIIQFGFGGGDGSADPVGQKQYKITAKYRTTDAAKAANFFDRRLDVMLF